MDMRSPGALPFTAILLAFAVLFGGASAIAASSDYWASLAGALVGAVLLALHALGVRPLVRGWSLALLPFAALWLVGMLQLLPLSIEPDGPIHEAARRVREMLGEDGAHPSTLAPSATVRVMLAALYPFAIALAALGATQSERVLAVKMIVGLAAASAAVAILDAVTGTPLFGPGYEGVFANENHQALLLSMIPPLLVALGLWQGRRRRAARVIGTALAFFLGFAGVILSGSLAGFGLFALSCTASAMLLYSASRSGAGMRLDRRAVAGMFIFVAVFAAALAATLPGLAGYEHRRAFWSALVVAALSSGPLGTGLGTFVDAARMSLPLELVGPEYLNHAHNEPLQILLEGGWILVILSLATAILLLVRMLQRLGKSRSGRHARLALLVAVLLAAAHSLVDYPLRTIGLASVVAVLLALLLTRTERFATVRSRGAPLALAAGCLAMLVPAHRYLGAERAYAEERDAEALSLDPDHAEARLALAERLRGEGRTDAAIREARAALNASPILSPALNLLVLGDLENVAYRETLEAFGYSGNVGQIPLVIAALNRGDIEAAADRIVAMLSERTSVPEAQRTMLYYSGSDARLAAAIARRAPPELLFTDSTAHAFNQFAEPERDQAVAGLIAILRAADAATIPPWMLRYLTFHFRQGGDAGPLAALYADLYGSRTAFTLSPYPDGTVPIATNGFDWNPGPSTRKLSIERRPSPALRIDIAPADNAMVATRDIVLPRGGIVRGTMSSLSGTQRVGLELHCGGRVAREEVMVEAVPQPVEIANDADCPVATLRIFARAPVNARALVLRGFRVDEKESDVKGE